MKHTGIELANNVYFWQKLDTLILSSEIVIDYPAGSSNKDYPNRIYPVDSGYLKDTVAADSIPVPCYRGSSKNAKATGLIVQTDILARDCFAKLLIGCTQEECATILKFINSTEFQKAIMVFRGDETPSWAVGEQ